MLCWLRANKHFSVKKGYSFKESNCIYQQKKKAALGKWEVEIYLNVEKGGFPYLE